MSDDKFFRETPALAEFGRRARALNLPEVPTSLQKLQGLYIWPGQQQQNMHNPMNYLQAFGMQNVQNPYQLGLGGPGGYGNAFADLLGSGR